MKKEIRVVDEKNNVVQITTIDERFYAIGSTDKTTGLPTYKYYPSVTYIAAFYPKGKFFEEWLKKMGDEAELIKKLAGEKGSKVHQAITDLLDGKSVEIGSFYINTTTGESEELTAEEYGAIVSFGKWFKATKPVIKNRERIVINSEIGYAGTLDIDCEIDGVPFIIDIKTSKSIWPSHILQVSSYKHTPDNDKKKVAILQVGYPRNKNGYKFTEVEDKFNLFLATFQIFQDETKNKHPRQIELPLVVTLGTKPKEEKKEKEKEKENLMDILEEASVENVKESEMSKGDVERANLQGQAEKLVQETKFRLVEPLENMSVKSLKALIIMLEGEKNKKKK